MNWKQIVSIVIIGIGGILSFPQGVYADNADIPNGLLVRAKGNDKVYYIEEGEKRHIWSPQMLESQFRWEDVIVTSPTDLEAIPTGDKMTFRDGSLLTDGKQGVYVIAEEKRRPIVSIKAFDKMGYKWGNIISVSTQELQAHESGEPLTSDDPYPNGTLLLAPNDEMYVVEDGERRYIPSPLIFEARYRWEAAIEVDQETLETYPRGNDEYYPDGLLIHDDQGVFLMQDNRRRPIASPPIFESYGLNWGKVRRATDFEMSLIPKGKLFRDLKTYADDTLITGDNTDVIYGFREGVLREIRDRVFQEHNFDKNEIIEFPARVLEQYKKGDLFPFPNRTVISQGDKKYLIEEGKRRLFPSNTVFSSLGYDQEEVIEVSQEVLESHSKGEPFPIPDGTVISQGDKKYLIEEGKRRLFPSDTVFSSLGYRQEEVIEVSQEVLESHPKGEPFPIPDGTVISQGDKKYLIEEGKRRLFPSDTVFLSLGYDQEEVIEVSQEVLEKYPKGEPLDKISSPTLNGISIPATEGKFAREQHLHTRCNETAQEFYERLDIPNSPSWLRNGVLDGGAFARRCESGDENRRATTTATAEEAKYYITMRWNYLDWYEAKTTLTEEINHQDQTLLVKDASLFPTTGTVRIGDELIDYTKESTTELRVEKRGAHQGDSMRNVITDNTVKASQAQKHTKEAKITFVYKYSGIIWYPRPFTKNFDIEKKNWHERKRVLVHNPKTDKYLVAAIIEAGPAMFTDRVAGLSPMAMYELGANNDDTLRYEFLLDQNTPLGPLRSEKAND